MGHAPILSTTGARYFLLLIDDFSWFSLLHPLHNKDQALPTFIKFKALVENQFNSPSLCLLYDNSGENIYIWILELLELLGNFGIAVWF